MTRARGEFTDKIMLHFSIEELMVEGTPVISILTFIKDKEGVIPNSLLVYPLYLYENKKIEDMELSREDIKYLLTKELCKAHSYYRHIRAFTVNEGKVWYNGKVYVFDPNKIVTKIMDKENDRITKSLISRFLEDYNEKMRTRKKVHITRL